MLKAENKKLVNKTFFMSNIISNKKEEGSCKQLGVHRKGSSTPYPRMVMVFLCEHTDCNHESSDVQSDIKN